jgi:hydrogenase expression/formation protein HypD
VKFQSEYRDPATARALQQAIAAAVTRPWTIMEVCGGQTHTIVREGLVDLLPPQIELVHGPGCPVCVTDGATIDQALALAARPDVIFCSFGDMLRVPGRGGRSLLSVKASGGDVRVVYSPLDCLKIARQHPERTVVFFAVGFETTMPATALAAWQAQRLGLANFALLVAHVRVPPAIEAILSSPQARIDGFLAAGHVCTVMGQAEYRPLVERFGVPIVITGFEPVDLLEGIWRCVQLLEQGRAELVNQYGRAVRPEGNPVARRYLDEVYELADCRWRGLGWVRQGGWQLRPAYRFLDARQRFGLAEIDRDEVGECLSGLVLQGQIKPPQCPAFGSRCTPEHPLGAPMVSAEGACAAYYHYRERSPHLRSAAAVPLTAGAASREPATPSTTRHLAAIDPECDVRRI